MRLLFCCQPWLAPSPQSCPPTPAPTPAPRPRSYDAVLAIDPAHWRSLLNKAVVQTCTGEKDEAAFNLKLALKLSGGWGWWRAVPLPAAFVALPSPRCSAPSFVPVALRIAGHRVVLLPQPPLPTQSRPLNSTPAAGHGSVLQQEVDQLKRMLKQGANWEVGARAVHGARVTLPAAARNVPRSMGEVLAAVILRGGVIEAGRLIAAS